MERIDCFSSLLLDIASCFEMDTNFPAAGNIYWSNVTCGHGE